MGSSNQIPSSFQPISNSEKKMLPLIVIVLVIVSSVQGATLPSRCPHPPICRPNEVLRHAFNEKSGCRLFVCVDRCPLFKCPPGAKRIETGQKDERGCPIIGCAANSRCPPYGIRCPAGEKEAVVGKDKRGCPKKGCVPK